MAPRLDLHAILVEALGTTHVYFQPPANVQMQYPCIVYNREINAVTKFADNLPYSYTKRYLVTVIDRDPNSQVPDKIAALKACIFLRFFTANDLNHDVFHIYF